MNKKIFTLFAGALLLLGSAFTVSAQTTIAPSSPYSIKYTGTSTVVSTAFRDSLSIDPVKYYSDDHYYVISVDTIVNQNGTAAAAIQTYLSSAAPDGVNSQLALFIDGDLTATDKKGWLRVDTIGNLDYSEKYNFDYNKSTKFGAIRRASWCVSNEYGSVQGSNRVWDFVNMESGRSLEVPMFDPSDEDLAANWESIGNGNIYKKDGKKINMFGDDLIVSGWHFSQTFNSQPLQTKMPLYSYVSTDSVVVLVLDEDYDVPSKTLKEGGYPVTVKQVSVNDLIANATGAVKTHPAGTPGTGKEIDNVILFSLKKINPFVLNADDYNAVNNAITFDKDANMSKGTDGWNPFTKGSDGNGNNGLGWLTAEEVSDSLYHYGYLYMKNSSGKYLYVDTAFWNTGNTNYLAFNFSSAKRDSSSHYVGRTLTLHDGFKWGDSYADASGTPLGHPYYYSDEYYEGELTGTPYLYYLAYDSIIPTGSTITGAAPTYYSGGTVTSQPLRYSAVYDYPGTLSATDEATALTASATAPNSTWTATTALGTGYTPANHTGTSSTPSTYAESGYYADSVMWLTDSVNYLYAFFKDSLMENQSKFRVVYDPWEDNTKINAYQTRYAYPDLENQKTIGAVWPNWWENSFDLTGKYIVAGNTISMPHQQAGGLSAAAVYKNDNLDNVETTGTWKGHRFSDVDPTFGDVYHGDNGTPGSQGTGDWHSFLEYFPKSSPNIMDKVMISTADTNAIYHEYFDLSLATVKDRRALAHSYSYSVTSGANVKDGQAYYQDSLFYVTIQDLDNGLKRIATIAQNGPADLRKITLNYGSKCIEDDSKEKASIGNNLYLIRNSLGQYLCVPIWSAMDSIYWVNPEHGEDPSRMPCYQWAVENIRGSVGSPFKMTNREFEHVTMPYVYVYANKDTAFDMAGKYAPKFNTRVVYSGISDTLTFGMKKVGTTPAYTVYQDGNDYIGWAEQIIPLSEKASFLPLNKDVKGDQLLGYKYIDKDSTLTNVYALKYKHFMTSGGKQRYVGWNGYEKDSHDTTLYVNYESEFDKLYFDLNEMPLEDVHPSDSVWTTDAYISIDSTDVNFASIYDKYARKINNYQNGDSIVMEKFGYMPTKKVSGNLEYDYNVIPGLKPLARQAYRFLLKDYYKFAPTISGDYWTVGENDNYILADKVYATKKYKPSDGNVCGVFGIPYFYLRNTFFDYQESDGNREVHDYFALVQRLDTNNYADNSGTSSAFEDIIEYLKYRFGGTAAEKVRQEIINSREFGAFVAVVEDYTASLKMAVRGDAAIRVSTFRLEQDNDPIYRRFHGNDSWADDGWDDAPDTLEFHRLNRGDLPLALFENSGNYLSFDSDNSLYGADGGRIYNYTDNTHKELLKDSLGNYISFLGVNNLNQYPGIQDGGVTNYSIFVDTAYIRRGTGWIKPQYLLAVDPYSPQECGTCIVNSSGEGVKTEPNAKYTIARYLYNTAMYAKQISDTVLDLDYKWQKQLKNYNMVKRINMSEGAYNSIVEAKDGKKYCDQNWERLAFTWAIHKGDSLFVLKGVEPAYGKNYVGDPERLYADLSAEFGDGGKYIDFEKLINLNTVKDADYNDIYYRGNNNMEGETRNYHTYKSMAQVIAEGRKFGLQAIIRLDDNTHKDWVFSMRYVERNSDDFVIESETTNRDTQSGAVIRPGYGGWVKYQNGIPVITRSDEKELMGEGLIMNVQKIKLGNSAVPPVSNDAISSNVAVVAGTGNVAILNATGKKVVISNILGQTIANTVLSSDNASIAVPAGVVVVAVEGESAVKAVVK